MKENITPCLWFNEQAKEAAELYCSAFPDSRVTAESPVVTEVNISGNSITLLDGGPKFRPNPSISMRYSCEDQGQFDRAWKKLTAGGSVIAEPVASGTGTSGWLTDKCGVSWQLVFEKGKKPIQKVTPHIVFAGKVFGKSAEAAKHYASVFKGSDRGLVSGADGSRMTLLGKEFSLADRDGVKGWDFSEGVSLTIHCKTQDEIDYYWSRLTEGGAESMCGWLKDRFGVWWQVIPVALSEIMSDPNKAQKAAKAFMAMRKLNIEQIVQASLA